MLLACMHLTCHPVQGLILNTQESHNTYQKHFLFRDFVPFFPGSPGRFRLLPLSGDTILLEVACNPSKQS